MNRKIIIFIVGITLIVSLGVAGYIIFKTPISPIIPSKPEAPPLSSDTGKRIAEWSTYRNNQYGFEIQYPPEYQAEENPDGVAIVGFFPKNISNSEAGGISGIKLYIRDNEFGSFDAYKNDLKNNLVRELVKSNYSAYFNEIGINKKDDSISEAEAANQIRVLNEKINNSVVELSGHYSVQEETVGGASVIFHKRDFFGFIGNIYEMRVGFNDNKVLIFYSEVGNDLLDRLYHTFRILK